MCLDFELIFPSAMCCWMLCDANWNEIELNDFWKLWNKKTVPQWQERTKENRTNWYCDMDFLRTTMETLKGMTEMMSATSTAADNKWYNWMHAIFANSFKDNVSVLQRCSSCSTTYSLCIFIQLYGLFFSRSIGRLDRQSLPYSLQLWFCSGLDGWTKVNSCSIDCRAIIILMTFSFLIAIAFLLLLLSAER